MNKLTYFLLALLLVLLRHQPGFAQQPTADESAIRQTLTHYIEGRNGGDLDRLRKAFHPTAALKFVQPDDGAMGEWSLEDYLKRLQPGQKLNCTGLITDIRIFNDAAQATVLLTYPNIRFHDYMSLLKVRGQWLIVDKTFARMPTKEKVLIVVTSHAALGDTDRQAGLNLKEVSHVYKALEERGFAVDFVSPKGAPTHLYGDDLNDPVNLWFAQHKEAWSSLHHTLTPEQVVPENYAAIYYAGGHGSMWDFPGNAQLSRIAARIYEQQGIVAGICHGTIGLLNITLSDGSQLVNGKSLTGFTDAEEKEIKLDGIVPMLLQTELQKKGARFVAAENWTSNVQSDQRLITGQNAQSVEALAKALVQALEDKVLVRQSR